MLLLSSSHRVISLLTVFISRSLPVNLHLIPSLLCVDSVLVLPLVFVRSFRFLLCVSPEAVSSASSSVSHHHMSSVICPWLYVSTLLLWFLVQPFVLLLCYLFLLDSGFFGSNPAGLPCVFPRFGSHLSLERQTYRVPTPTDHWNTRGIHQRSVDNPLIP